MLAADALARARALFPLTSQGRIYIDHAAVSPFSTRVVQAVQGHLRERSTGILETLPEDMAVLSDCRLLVQRLINAESPDRIALVPNTSDGINIVASGLPWKAGDRVLLNDAEFPANVYPYRNLECLGVTLDILHAEEGGVSPEMIERMLTPSTRLVGLSAVQYLSGYRADLESIGALCRRRNVLLVVDAIQAAGAVRLDVRRMRIDALASGCQKWQMSPQGAGWLYVTEELQSQIRPAHFGWLGVADIMNFADLAQAPAPGARRYEGGSWVMPSLYGMRAALQTILEYDTEAIERHLLDLTGIVLEEANRSGSLSIHTPRERNRRGGIATLGLPAGVDPERVHARLLSRGIFLSLRRGKLRLSPHFYNSPDDVRAAVEAILECLRTA